MNIKRMEKVEKEVTEVTIENEYEMYLYESMSTPALRIHFSQLCNIEKRKEIEKMSGKYTLCEIFQHTTMKIKKKKETKIHRSRNKICMEGPIQGWKE
jgi:hypothetical protein